MLNMVQTKLLGSSFRASWQIGPHKTKHAVQKELHKARRNKHWTWNGFCEFLYVVFFSSNIPQQMSSYCVRTFNMSATNSIQRQRVNDRRIHSQITYHQTSSVFGKVISQLLDWQTTSRVVVYGLNELRWYS